MSHTKLKNLIRTFVTVWLCLCTFRKEVEQIQFITMRQINWGKNLVPLKGLNFIPLLVYSFMPIEFLIPSRSSWLAHLRQSAWIFEPFANMVDRYKFIMKQSNCAKNIVPLKGLNFIQSLVYSFMSIECLIPSWYFWLALLRQLSRAFVPF